MLLGSCCSWVANDVRVLVVVLEETFCCGIFCALRVEQDLLVACEKTLQNVVAKLVVLAEGEKILLVFGRLRLFVARASHACSRILEKV